MNYLQLGFAVLSVVGVAAAMPSTLFHPLGTDSSDQTEQTRMYVVDPTRSVEFRVPASARNVRIQVVGEVDVEGRYDPSRLYRFSMWLTMKSARGDRTLATFPVEVLSRVSIADDVPTPESRRATVLRTPGRFATDLRSVFVPVSEFTGRSACRLIVRGDASSERPLLLRASAQRASASRLPWLDDRYSHRLAAQGLRGRDYFQEFVVLSDYRRPVDLTEVAPEQGHVDVGPYRWARYRMTGPGRVELRGRPGARIYVWERSRYHRPNLERLTRADRIGRPVVLNRAGVAVWPVRKGGPRRLVLSARAPTPVSVTHRRAGRAPVELRPRSVKSPYYALSETPLSFAVEPGQRELRLRLRRRGAGAVRADWRAFGAGEAALAEASVRGRVRRSRLDQLPGGGPISRMHEVSIPVPAGAHHIEVRGESPVLVRAMASFDGVRGRTLGRVTPTGRDQLDAEGRRQLVERQRLSPPPRRGAER